MSARSTSIFCWAICGSLIGRRPDLKVVITSATIDTEAFSAAFGDAPVIKVEGRTYPVEVIYAPLDSFGSDADPDAADAGGKGRSAALHRRGGGGRGADPGRPSTAGDILVFMPSERDVRETCDLLEGGKAGAATWCRSSAG